MNTRRLICGLIAAISLGTTGCGADDAAISIEPDRTCDDELGKSGSIQRAVDRAQPGDIVEIPAGTYHESVVVNTNDITIRGIDRNTVILDGCDGRLGNGVLIYGNQVTVENLTVRGYSTSGIMFNGLADADDNTPIDGFAMRYITALDNGMYGLYSFQAINGVITDSYTAGSADSGVYVGQCSPCNVLVDRIVAEYNAVGYEGTNGSEVWIVNSVWRNNRIGMTPNSQALERLAPQQGGLIAGNIVADNNSTDAPEQASGGHGMGIVLGGGNNNHVANNLVTGHDQVGVAVTSLDGYDPANNRIDNNVVTGNQIDLAYWIGGGLTPTAGNTFTGNTYDTSSPANIEQAMNSDQVDAPIVRVAPGPAYTGSYPAAGDLEPMPAGIEPVDLPYTGPFPTLDQIVTPTGN